MSVSVCAKGGLRPAFLRLPSRLPSRPARAVRAYEKFGFEREGEECTAIGDGYYMDDYIYSYRLQK